MKLTHSLFNVVLMVVVVFVTAMLSGCLATTKVVTKMNTLYQEVPQELTVAVKPSPPVEKVVYLSMPLYERERYMSAYAVELLRNLNSCNAQLEGISSLSKQWKAQE